MVQRAVGAKALLAVATNKNTPSEYRLAALKGLKWFHVRTSDDQIPQISRIARDPSEPDTIVKAAVKTLGSLGEIRSARELVAIAGRGGPVSTYAIEQLATTGAQLLGVEPQLIALYNQIPLTARAKLLPRLAELNDPAATALISKALKDPQFPATSKAEFIGKIQELPFKKLERLLPTLCELLSSSTDQGMRRQALYLIFAGARSLGPKDNSSFVAQLQKVAESPHDPLRHEAQLSLALQKNDNQALITVGISPAIDPRTRATALYNFIPTDVNLPTLRQLTSKGAPPEVRINAAYAIGRLKREEGAKLIGEILTERLPPEARKEGLRALSRLLPSRGMDQIKEELASGTIPPEVAAELLVSPNNTASSSITTPVLVDLLKKLPPTSPRYVEVVNAIGASGRPDLIASLKEQGKRTQEGSPTNTDAFLAARVRLGDKEAVDQVVSRLNGTFSDSGDFLRALAASPSHRASTALASQLLTLPSISKIQRLIALENLTTSGKLAFGRRLIEAAKEVTIPQQQSFLRSYGEAIVTAINDLDIKSPFRYPPEFLISAVRERRNGTPDGRPLAVVITAREDHNYSFNWSIDYWTNLKQAGYRVMLYEVATDTAAATALRSATAPGQRADLIILAGHGSKHVLSLGASDPQLVSSSNSEPNDPATITKADEPLLRGVSDTLRPNGTIIADSCLLGEGGRGADNIASLLTRVFPQAKEFGIYTATDSVSESTTIDFSHPSGPKIEASVDMLKSAAPKSNQEGSPA